MPFKNLEEFENSRKQAEKFIDKIYHIAEVYVKAVESIPEPHYYNSLGNNFVSLYYDDGEIQIPMSYDYNDDKSIIDISYFYTCGDCYDGFHTYDRTMHLPTSYLLMSDEEIKNEALAYHNKKVEEQKQKEAEEAAKRAKRKEKTQQKRHELYLKLKEEFES